MKPYFVVEEGQFNLGSFDVACQMIEATAMTGADAIEFQLAYADDFYLPGTDGHRIYKSREFSDDQLKELVYRAKQAGLEFVATCLSPKLVVKMTEFGADRFNINASDINNPSMIDRVVESGKPFFMSVALATQTEIDWALTRVRSKGGDTRVTILHGQHPMASGDLKVAVEDTALGYLKTLENSYGVPVGFVDHTDTVHMAAIAVAAGAQVITKHMTLSHLYKGPDHHICLSPEEMKTCIDLSRAAFNSIVIDSKELAKGEDLDRTIMRRSIVTVKNISKGQVIDESMLDFKRPGDGISPSDVETILGKTAKVDISEHSVVTKEMF